MENIKSIIIVDNKDVIMKKKTEAVNCYYINKPDCPLSNHYQITNIIYKAKITSNLWNYHGEKFLGTCKGVHLNSEMEFIRNYSTMKNIGQVQTFEGILEI